MLDALLEFGRELITRFGLSGLFTISFLTSIIIIPVPIDLFVVAAVAGGLSPFSSAISATVGATLGAGVDYYLGYYGSKAISKKFSHRDFHRASDWIKKYGAAAVFLVSLLPLPYDVIAIAAGAGRMNFLPFLTLSFLGKIIKYLAVAYAFVGGLYLFADNPDIQTELKIAGILILVIVVIYYLRVNSKNGTGKP